MANFSIRPSLTFSLVSLSLILATPSSMSKVVDVNVICSSAIDPSFCSKILNSKPGGAKGADLVSLAHYASEVARANVNNTIKLINMLIEKSGSDRKVKAKYNSCLSNFTKQFGCLGHIDSLQKFLKKGNYYLVEEAALGIISNVNTCLTRYDPEEPPFPDTTDLHTFVDIVKKVAGIIVVISKYLMEK